MSKFTHISSTLRAGEYLDRYQERVEGRTIYESTTQTIGGLAPPEYFHNGLAEKLGKSLGMEGCLAPRYSQLGAITFLDGNASMCGADESAPDPARLRCKKFGEVSWFLAGRLAVVNVSMSSALGGRPGGVEL